MAESRKRKHDKATIETRGLIGLVHERPCLWDRSMTEYRDRSEKEKAWLEIYKIIEPDYDDFKEEMKNLVGTQITKKWYNVRDSYVKSKKQHRSVRNRPYIYTEQLQFLDSSLNPEDSEYDENKQEDFENIEEHWLNDEIAIDIDDTSQAEPNTETVDKAQDNVIGLLANLIKREEDHDRAFFTSIVPMVKALSDESKFEFRIQVMTLLKNLKSKEKKLCVKREKIDTNNYGSDDDRL